MAENKQQLKARTEKDNRFQITTRTGEVIKLDKQIVIKYLTDNTEITDAEFNMFFQLCKVYKVNPFLKEAYIIKYGAQPATIVLDYKVLQQIAEENPNYQGMKHGVIVQQSDGSIITRHGGFKLPDDNLIAGWCEVYRADRAEPTRVVAMFDEFKGLTKNGELNTNWRNKPVFMITKVAKAQALREAFPNLVASNIYIPEETDSFNKPTNLPDGNTTVDNNIIPEENIDDGIVPETTDHSVKEK